MSSAALADANRLGIELPVRILGSQSVAAVAGLSAGLEPFREDTTTVIVFPQGGVVRLSANVGPGQTIILTNKKTKQDVVCRVVSVRNYPNVKGYVELEFTEAAANFWHVNFEDAPLIQMDRPADHEPPPQEDVIEEPAPEIGAPAAAAPMEVSHAAETPAPALAVPEPEPAPPPAAGTAPHPEPPLIAPTPPSSQVKPDAWRTLQRENAKVVEIPKPVVEKAEPKLLAGPAEQPRRTWLMVAAVAGFLILAAAGGYFWLRHGSSGATANRASSPAATSQALNTPPATSANPSAPNPAEASQPAQAQPAPSSQPSVQPAAQPPASSLPTAQGAQLAGAKSESKPAVEQQKQTSNASPAVTPSKVPSRKSPALQAIKQGMLIGPSAPQHSANLRAEDAAAPNLNVAVPGNLTANPAGGILGGSISTPAPPPTSASVSGAHIMQPQLLTAVRPLYPRLARESGVEGDVTLEATIDATGKVANIKVVSGDVRLQQPAMDALRNWKYAPAKLDDKPVAMKTVVTIRFRLR